MVVVFLKDIPASFSKIQFKTSNDISLMFQILFSWRFLNIFLFLFLETMLCGHTNCLCEGNFQCCVNLINPINVVIMRYPHKEASNLVLTFNYLFN